MLFALAEVFCVFLPIVVHLLVLLLKKQHESKSVFDQPDLLYAAVVLPAIAVCKYLFAYLTAHRKVSGARVFPRVLWAGLCLLLSGIILGLFFGEPTHGGWWCFAEIALPLIGALTFLLASSDYFALTH